MSRIRIEWIPIKKWSLGSFGFDHLQLVFQEDCYRKSRFQSQWWVLEGTRDRIADVPYPILGVNGADGRTTLAEANPTSKTGHVKRPTADQLQESIGTPESRGSRALPFTDNYKAWNTMCAYAAQLDGQMLPYVCASLSPSGPPTINSASVIASLLHYGGIENVGPYLPKGLRFSPGTKTFLGLPDQNDFKIPDSFNAVVARNSTNTIKGKRKRRWQTKAYDVSTQTLACSIKLNGLTEPSRRHEHEGCSRYEMSFEQHFPIPNTTIPTLAPLRVTASINTQGAGTDSMSTLQAWANHKPNLQTRIQWRRIAAKNN